MGRHQLLPAPRRTGRARHALPRQRSRIAAPATMAAALLISVPTGTALADDETPPPAVDGLGTALGSALGTDSPESDADGSDADGPGSDQSGSDEESDSADAPASDDAPVTGADLVGDALGGNLPTGDLPSGDDVTQVENAAAELVAPAAGATQVTLLEKNGSGVTGTATIDAESVVATATGLDPTQRYVSFFYGATSSATNNNPCILDGTNPLPSDQTIGEWDVDADGNGTLSAPNPLGARYTLQAGTISIRQVQHDFSTATALPVNPLSYTLVACGEVQRIEVLDPVTDLVPKLPRFPSLPPLS